MAGNIWHECLCFASYYAPRGRPRLLMLGETIGQRYLSPNDLLIGVMGEAGIGKSSVINGMMPGLELTNDDDGVNVRPPPLVRMARDGRFTAHTFHIDARFEMAFMQLYEIADAIKAALEQRRRVVVEHFDAIYPVLGINAQFLMGIGEEVIVARPNVFGPFPDDIAKAIEGTAVFRKMAHTAEDLTAMVLERDFGIPVPTAHSDVPRGFVIEFDAPPPGLDIHRLRGLVEAIIRQGAPVDYQDGTHIRIGETEYRCTGPRIHVGNASEITNFRLMDELVFDPLTQKHCLVGVVGEPKTIHFIERHPDRAGRVAPPG